MSSVSSPALLPAELGLGLPAASAALASGLLPACEISKLVKTGVISSEGEGIDNQQIQPASLDVRLGARGFRLRASFLPGPEGMLSKKLPHFALEEIDMAVEPVLAPGSTYLVALEEALSLPKNMDALASPKSSTGRVDVFVRLLPERGAYFDTVPSGYHGQLWLEITPQSFPIKVRRGTKLAQLRFRRGGAAYDNYQLKKLHDKNPLVEAGTSEAGRHGWRKSRTLQLDKGLVLSVDLAGDKGAIGYQARKHTPVLDMDKNGVHAVEDFFQPVHAPKSGWLVLAPGAFYLLASREAVRIPPSHAAEMLPLDPRMGEFRAHYAGFFDPGFGYGSSAGARAVLEIRSRDTAFILEHGQTLARLQFEKLTRSAELLYDAREDASYRGQGLALSRHFKR